MLKIGVIGYGKMGLIRHSIFDNIKDCHVVAICNDTPAEGGKAKFYDNPHELIHDPGVNAVCICTPNHLIAPLAIEAMKAGKHVIAEKPPGMTLEQTLEMKRTLESKPGLKLKFGFNHRYHDAVIEAKKRVDSGAFGKILWMRGRYGKSVDEHFKESWRAKKAFAGGGILLDQGIHMVDLFLHFAGEFEEAKGFIDNHYWGLDIEDNAFAILRNSKGQTASLHSTMTQWRHLFSLEIFLEKGYMVVNGILSATRSYTDNYGKEELSVALNRSQAPMARHTHEERFMFDRDFSFHRECEEFAGCVLRDEDVKVGNIEDAERLMRVINAIYKDAGSLSI